MRKLIEIEQEKTIVCDNPSCDFEVLNSEDTPSIIESFLNVICPKCGENLLTEDDLYNHLKVVKTVNWINKWFSWITIFSFKKSKQKYVGTCTTHKEIKIEIKKP